MVEGHASVRKETSGMTKDNMETGDIEGYENTESRKEASNEPNEMKEDHRKSNPTKEKKLNENDDKMIKLFDLLYFIYINIKYL